jgi:O-antigen/teichoic acid export membrane protein
MPSRIHRDAQWSLLIVGGSLAISLPFTVFGAIFVGLQRYDIPAWIIGSSKFFSGVLVVLISYLTHSMVWMSVGMGVANLLGGFLQYLAYRRLASDISVEFTNISKKSGIEITKYCSGLLVWSVGMLLVSGLDAAIIGYFDYTSVIYYTLAASLTSFVMGVQSSVLTTLLPKAAKIGATGDREGLGTLLVSANRYAVIILIITSFPLIFSGRHILMLWLGSDYAFNIEVLLQFLVLANCIRQIGAPYAVIAIAVGEQKTILLSPIMEGILNLLISVLLTARFGVIGVAIGTLVSAIFSVVMNFYYNLPRTKSILMPKNISLFHESFRLLSIISPVPFIWLLYTYLIRHMVSSLFDIMICVSANIILICLIYGRILTKSERYIISTKFRKFCMAII